MVTISIGDGSIHLENIPDGVPAFAVRFCFFVRGGEGRSHGEATADPLPFHHLASVADRFLVCPPRFALRSRRPREHSGSLPEAAASEEPQTPKTGDWEARRPNVAKPRLGADPLRAVGYHLP